MSFIAWETTNPADDRGEVQAPVSSPGEAVRPGRPRLRPASNRVYVDDLSYEPQLYMDLLPVTFAPDSNRTRRKA